MEILAGEIKRNDLSKEAKGGSELLAYELQKRIPQDLLKDFQIVLSRVRELEEDKIRIYWAHDLPGDPESNFLKDKSKHDLFHKYIFVSHWQQQAFIQSYGLPWSKCLVLQNAINPIPAHEKPLDTVNMIYFSTPHRGLEILYPVFDRLAERYPNIHLDVFSSFELYGWPQRDKPFLELFDKIKKHERMTFHGAKDNDTIRRALESAHILAYPSIWPETSCLVLMESMSAGLLCCHSNFAALPETAANWTMMYPFHEDPNSHASAFYQVLDVAIQNINDESVRSRLKTMKSYVDVFYNWKTRENHWKAALTAIKNQVGENRGLPKSDETFRYTG